jgi:hypothetical protein
MTVVWLTVLTAVGLAVAGVLCFYSARRDERRALLAELQRQAAIKRAARRAAVARWREERRAARPREPAPAGAPAPTTAAAVALQGANAPSEPAQP